MSKIADAISAYASAARSVVPGDKTEDAQSSGAEGSTFATMIGDVTKASLTAARSAEKLSQEAVAGKADIREVVAAVTNAEITLETVTTVRDKVVNAYNEIMRMPI